MKVDNVKFTAVIVFPTQDYSFKSTFESKKDAMDAIRELVNETSSSAKEMGDRKLISFFKSNGNAEVYFLHCFDGADALQKSPKLQKNVPNMFPMDWRESMTCNTVRAQELQRMDAQATITEKETSPTTSDTDAHVVTMIISTTPTVTSTNECMDKLSKVIHKPEWKIFIQGNGTLYVSTDKFTCSFIAATVDGKSPDYGTSKSVLFENLGEENIDNFGFDVGYILVTSCPFDTDESVMHGGLSETSLSKSRNVKINGKYFKCWLYHVVHQPQGQPCTLNREQVSLTARKFLQDYVLK